MSVEIILQALWFMIPAYVANPSAVLFGGGMPMDFNRSLSDGRRILGDGKTWRGFVGGISAGVSIGLIQQAVAAVLDIKILIFGSFPSFFIIIFLLALGSMLGDLTGSFVKRRSGSIRGVKRPLIDMYSFLGGAFLLLLILQWNWTSTHYFYNGHIIGLVTVIVATPLLHRGVNIIGYKMGKTDVPW